MSVCGSVFPCDYKMIIIIQAETKSNLQLSLVFLPPLFLIALLPYKVFFGQKRVSARSSGQSGLNFLTWEAGQIHKHSFCRYMRSEFAVCARYNDGQPERYRYPGKSNHLIAQNLLSKRGQK